MTDDPIARLLAAVGPRKEPSELELARLKRVAVARWQRVAARRRLRRRAVGFGAALAASALLATLAALGWGWLGGPATVGSVQQVAGAAWLTVGDAPTTPLAAGVELPTGARLETGPAGRLAVRLRGGVSLRLSGDSRIALLAPDRVALDGGTVYLDSSAVADDSAVEVRTALGSVTDIGTRFEVKQREGVLRVRVRDGRVAVARDGERHEAGTGTQLLVPAEGEPVRSEIAVHGGDWRWILETAPPFEIEGRTLGEFLAWVAGETGWRIDLPAAQEEALRSIVLHGSVAGLTPAEAPDLVLPGCGVDYRIADGTLSLRRPVH